MPPYPTSAMVSICPWKSSYSFRQPDNSASAKKRKDGHAVSCLLIPVFHTAAFLRRPSRLFCFRDDFYRVVFIRSVSNVRFPFTRSRFGGFSRFSSGHNRASSLASDFFPSRSMQAGGLACFRHGNSLGSAGQSVYPQGRFPYLFPSKAKDFLK